MELYEISQGILNESGLPVQTFCFIQQFTPTFLNRRSSHFFPKCFAITALHLEPSVFNARLTLLSILCMTTVFSPAADWALPPLVCWHGGHTGCCRQAPCSSQRSPLEPGWSLARSQDWLLRAEGPFLALWIQSLGLTEVWPPAASLEVCEGLIQSCLHGALTPVVACRGHIPCGPLGRIHHPRDRQSSQQAQVVVPCLEGSSCEVVATHRGHGCPVRGMEMPWRWAVTLGGWG